MRLHVLAALVCAMVACGASRPSRPIAASPAPTVHLARLGPPKDFAGHDWRGTAAAPLDVIGWIDDRDCILHAICSHEESPAPKQPPRPAPRLVRTHRASGPPNLDADIASIDVDVRGCFRTFAETGARLPRIKATLVARRSAPLAIASIEPSDTPPALQMCVRDALREIRAFAPAPVVIVAGASF